MRPYRPRLTAWIAAFLIALAAAPPAWAAAAGTGPTHGLAMHGAPALPSGFDHLPYADPAAPKGGRVTYAGVGAFDSMNPFIVRGTAPRGIWDELYGRNLWESLLTRNRAEPFSLYGLIAERVETPPDRSWVEFTIHPRARFADGAPILPDDILFTAALLQEKGKPSVRAILRDQVASVMQTGERRVRYTFKGEPNRELPMLIGLMPVLPKHAVDPATFDKTSLVPPLGSGAYRLETIDAGRTFTLKRRDDYWGRDLPIKRGFDNFDAIRFDYYRDANALFEAFKKGLFDVLQDTDPVRWATKYDFPAALDGRVVREPIRSAAPRPMTGLVFNTQRPILADRRVREALTHCIDFEWLNRSLYRGLYRRNGSFFEGSDLSALGRAAGAAERALLAPFPDAVTPAIMDGSGRPPASTGTGVDRDGLRTALTLLQEAGYRRDGRVLRNGADRPLAVEMLVKTAEDEDLGLSFQRTCALIGVAVEVRRVESLQYELKVKSGEYDMIRFIYPSSLSPGGEQKNRWFSTSAGQPGSFNFANVRSPAVDAAINALLGAVDQDAFTAAVRALDRVLISGAYLVPLFYAPDDWWARWARIGHPATRSLYGAEPTTWWAEPPPAGRS